MKTKLECVIDNTRLRWMTNGLLHREDGPAVITGKGEAAIKEYWLDGWLVNAAMLALHSSLSSEVEKIIKNREVVFLDSIRK